MLGLVFVPYGIEVSAKHYLQVPEELYNKVVDMNEAQTATRTATKPEGETETTNRSEYKIGSGRSL